MGVNERQDVPPAPVEMRREEHQRLNQWLLVSQIAELVLQGFGFAALQFGAAILGLFNFTLTGKYNLRRDNQDEAQDDGKSDS